MSYKIKDRLSSLVKIHASCFSREELHGKVCSWHLKLKFVSQVDRVNVKTFMKCFLKCLACLRENHRAVYLLMIFVVEIYDFSIYYTSE